MQQVDDPPSLPVGTEVSAKYKGAFCEAKVRKVVRNIKVKVLYKQGLGSGIVSDDAIKFGALRVGAVVEVRHPERRDNVEATITKIQDGSQYTVVFDDGDITTLRRTALCLKSGRHFNESETLDQLPLTHPEHFGNPVIGGRRGGRRSRHLHDDSSEEEDEPIRKGKVVVSEKEENIGKVVCVESNETKKKDKDKWFPGLVVAPTAQVTVKIRVKDEYLVRSFKDGRYYTVPKKEAMEFTKEMASKQDGPAVQAALVYLDNENALPPHWDRDALFGLSNSSTDYEGELDSDSSDDEPREEKDHFVAQLYKHMDDRGTPLNKVPSIQNRDVDFYRLFRAVQKLGGYNRVTSQNQWKSITIRLGFTPISVSVTNLVKQAYKKFLQPYEEFHRKLGCSMLMTPRNSSRSKGRSLVRANSVASPKPELKDQPATPTTKLTQLAAEESENTSESSIDIIKTKRKTSTGSSVGKVKSLVEKFEEKCKEEAVPQQQEPSTSKQSVTLVSKEKPKEQKETVVEEKPPTPPPIPRVVHTIPIPQSSTTSPLIPQHNPSGPPSIKKERITKSGRPEEKRGRKKKEIVEPTIVHDKPTEKTGEVPLVVRPDFPVEAGDKLKVYYHEKKVTYEAKVIEISVQKGKPLYLVHYTGWNTRYDEWVPKERIAENLTNNKNKKSKGSQSHHSKSHIDTPTRSATVIKTMSKRGRGRSDSQPPRSTTPSSVASNSSRTKSPATPATQRRITRTQPNPSRRTSNNVSDTSLQTDSDSDSDEPVIRKPTRSVLAAASALAKGPPTFKTSSNTSPNSETEEDESAKGRDYDLNQIRSELKGFKELKSPSPEPDTPDPKKPDKIFEFPIKQEIKSESKPINEKKKPIVALMESKSSSELSSDTDSFVDDDSQSSDKTTQLQNMTQKLQQKIKAEKLAQDKFNTAGIPVKNASTNDIISPLTSAGVEKIIKDSLAEKRQETLKAIKPFLIEKPITKIAVSAGPAATTAVAPLIEKTEEKPIIKLETPVKVQITRQNLPDKKIPISVEANNKKSILVSSSDTKTVLSGSFEKKFIPIPPAVSSSPSITIISVTEKTLLVPKKETETIPVIITAPTIVKNETISSSSLKTSIPTTSATSTSTSSVTTSVDKTVTMGTNLPVKAATVKEPLLKSMAKPQPTAANADLSSNIKNDIYEFKEPEPFEFEARKTTTNITGITSAPATAIPQHSETEKKKKTPSKTGVGTFESSVHDSKVPLIQTTQAVSTILTTPSTPTIKKPKKSPMKEEKTTQPTNVVSQKQTKLDEKHLPLPELPAQPSTPATPLLSPPPAINVTKPETTFDVLRKSPSFNLNINALNEELATTVQETTKVLTEINQVSSPIMPLAPIAIAGPSQKLPYITPFVETSSDIANVFEVKRDTEKSSSSDDEDQKGKKRKNRSYDLEAVKKMLLSDNSVFDLEPPKVEKPTSIADKVLKALNQKKEEEEKTRETKEIKETTKPSNPTILKTTEQLSTVPSTSTAIISSSSFLPTATNTPTTLPAIAEPPKIEIPIFIKKDFEVVLQKPILNSPEHKLDILESIAPKNNDLTETIQKLESAIFMKTPNVDPFDEDSSDSTDSEQRLVIEDEESSDENPLNDTLSAPEFSPLKKSESALASIITGPSTSAAAVAAANAIASLATAVQHYGQQPSISTKKSEEKSSISILTRREIVCKPEESIFTLAAAAAATKDNVNVSILQSKSSTSAFGSQASNFHQSLLSDAGVKPIIDINHSFKSEVRRSNELPELSITLKKEEPPQLNSLLEITATTQNVHTDSINLLLCEETIPGSPQPITAKDIMDTALSKINMHPTESDIKPIPMDIECAGPIPPLSTNNCSAAVSAVAAAVKLITKVEQQTPSSSPNDSQSPDDSSEDLKKPLDRIDGNISPKKRRRTRKHSEAECHMKRRRGNRGIELNAKKNNGSDSDDNSDANVSQRPASSRPIRPCQYNFLVQLDSALNPNQRISILRKKITELRKTYNMIKAELASIDRRRKKLRRREREKKQQQKQQLNV